MDAITEYLFKQGLGYVLFIAMFFIWVQTARLLLAEKDKNAAKLAEMANILTGFGKDITNGLTNNTNATNTLTNIVNERLK